MKSAEKVIRGIPDFLAKLWYMVNDSSLSSLINWTEDGTAFAIRNDVTFCFTVLPQYYKHNNMSSFIRQLNLYGFNKVTSLDESVYDKNEYLFCHPFFRKGQPQLLKMIKRKVSASKAVATGEKTVNETKETEQLSHVLEEVKYLKNHQSQVESVISRLQSENTVMWREFAVLRQKHIKLQQIVNKLIHFLVTIVQPSRMGGIGVKRRHPLMIKDTPSNDKKPKLGEDCPTICELDGDLSNFDPCTQSAASTSQDPVNEQLLNEITSVPNVEQPLSVEMPDPVADVSGDFVNYSHIYDNFNVDSPNEEILLNPTSGDALLASLGGNPVLESVATTTNKNSVQSNESEKTNDMSLVTVTPTNNEIHKSLLDDINEISVNSTETDLEHLKDALSTYTSIDPTLLLGLFSSSPQFGLYLNDDPNLLQDDPLLGSELMLYDPNTLDFPDLLDENIQDSSINVDDNKSEES